MIDLNELLELAANEAAGAQAPTYSAIAKELLHYEIMLAISRSEVAPRIAFQGGTALRLCYGGQRYSEDLVFVCGSDAKEPFRIDDVERLLHINLKNRYGLSVQFQQPAEDKLFSLDRAVVKRWKSVVEVPGLDGFQRINIEFCNVPAYDAAPRLIRAQYSFLPQQYRSILVRTESLEEIFADKIIALANRPFLKARDVWDVLWLSNNGVRWDIKLVQKKMADYSITDFGEKLEVSIARLQSPESSKQFAQEMSRFVAPEVLLAVNREKPAGKVWLNHAVALLMAVKDEIGDGERARLRSTFEGPTF
jgi:predicted nucleotidyltransferase component of viral defense system